MTLKVKDLNKTFITADKRAAGIFDVNFDLEPGSFFTLLGPSGCGKTTTLRSVAGLQQPDTGFVGITDRTYFDSDKGINLPMNRRGIGMVFQSYAIWPHMTVGQNVGFPLTVSSAPKLSKSDLSARIARALDAVDLGGYQDRPATRLSGGQQQRVALARAIVAEPKLLLLDEPLSNLDASLREVMRAELKRLQQQLGVTTVYVTHDQSEALEMSDTIAVMDQGRIVQMGPPQDIYFRPANRFVATFIGTTNLLPGKVESHTAEGETGAVVLDGGSRIECLFPTEQPAGAAIEVSVRPEVIRIGRKVADGAGADHLHGQIAQMAFQGSSFRYGVRVGAHELTVHGSADDPFAVGEDVDVSFAARSAVVVADSGTATTADAAAAA